MKRLLILLFFILSVNGCVSYNTKPIIIIRDYNPYYGRHYHHHHRKHYLKRRRKTNSLL